jgi:hypothetical protein
LCSFILLPAALTGEASAFTLAGWLEPAASIGGGTFDYSLVPDVLHCSALESMKPTSARSTTTRRSPASISGCRTSRSRGVVSMSNSPDTCTTLQPRPGLADTRLEIAVQTLYAVGRTAVWRELG